MGNLFKYRYKPDPTKAFYASADGGFMDSSNVTFVSDIENAQAVNDQI